MTKHARVLTTVSAALSLLGIWLLAAYFQWGREQTSRFWLLAFFGAATAMGARLFCARDKRLRRYGLIFGFCLTLTQALGYRLDALGTVGEPSAWLLPVGAAVCLAPAAGEIFAALARLLGRTDKRPNEREGFGFEHGANDLACAPGGAERDVSAPEHAAPLPARQPHMASNRQAFWFCVIVLLLCWLPVFLAYYPGIFAYDVLSQIPQVISGEYSAHHPLAHTLLMGGFYMLGGAFGSPTAGMAMYTVFQMLCMALIIAYALSVLRRAGAPCWIRIACLLLYALMPFHSMIAISHTKDSLFSALLLLLAALLFQGLREWSLWRKPVFWIQTALTVFGICALRNNGVFAVAGCAALTVWFFKEKALRVRFLAAFLTGFALYGGVSAGLKMGLNASGVNTRESLCVPIQQVARTFNLHTELASDPEVQPLWERTDEYRPTLADPAKRFSRVGMSTLKPFFSLWQRFLVQYPTEYADAFLLLTRGYWHLSDTSHATVNGENPADRMGYLQSWHAAGLGVSHSPLLPGLEALYERLFSANEYQRIPIFSALFAPALWAWAVWLALLLALYRKKYAVFAAGAALPGLFATLLLGPCCLVRYAHPLMLVAPVLIGMLLSSRPKPVEAGMTQSR